MYTVFIADDEITECKALEMMIRNGMRSCKVIGYANNGTDLLKAMEGERPDIAIIDINMPGLTGLEVLEFIRMRNYSTKIVINTAYSDFSYIKKAMKYKVSDYILKPVKREELYSILNGICKQLDEERKQKQKVTRVHSMENQMSEMAKNFFVTSLLLGEFDEMSFALLSRSFQLPYLGGCMMVIQLESDRDAGNNENQWMEQVQCIFDTEFERSVEYISKCYNRGIYYYLMPGISRREFEEWFVREAETLCANIQERYGYALRIGVSLWKREPPELLSALEECRRAVHSRDESGIYFYEEPRRKTSRYYEEKIQRWRSFFEEEQIGKVSDEMRKIIQETMEKKEELEGLKLDSLLCLMELFYQTGNAPARFACMAKFKWAKLLEGEDGEILLEQVERLLEMYEEKLKSMNLSENIKQTLGYMDENFAKDLSLDDAAENVGITPFYLSRLFKQEIGLGFTGILTDIRMGKVWMMLQNSEYSIREISERTGFASLSYFYKVFKKYFGITVGEMRELVGN